MVCRMHGETLRKLVRSALFRTPKLFTVISSESRFVLLHRLGLVVERDFRALPLLVDSPTPTILDIGANFGQSVLAVKRVLPTAQVVSFEPNPACWPGLGRVGARFADVTVQRFGLADENGGRDFYCPAYNGKVMSGLASFDRESAEDWLSPRTVFGFRPGLLTVQQSRLELRRLDELNLSPDVAKIDVQGLEDRVVSGGLETIRRCRPTLIVETPTQALCSLLAGEGYVAMEFDGARLVPSRHVQLNEFFVHRTRAPAIATRTVRTRQGRSEEARTPGDG